LHVIGGNDRGKQCELSKMLINIGRGADQDLVLADIAVSRRHIKIHLLPGGYKLQDLGSGNGTLINGKRVDEVMLVDGDQIELGNTLLRFEHPPSRAQVEAPQAMPAPMPPQPQPGYPPPAMPQAMPPQAMPQPGYPPPGYPPPGYPPQPQYPSQAMPMAPPYASAVAQAVAPPGYPPQQPQPMMPQPMAPPMAGGPMGVGAPAPAASFLDAGSSRKIAFGAVGGLLIFGLLGLGYTVRSGHATPATDVNEALAHYTAGTKHFQANDFDAARKAFQSALEMAPESQELKHYLEACDVEAKALGFIKEGRRSLEQRRYGEALKSFQQVDEKSVQYDYAQQQARDARREAANTALTEAKNLSLSDAGAALTKINEGLQYDPDNPALMELKGRVASGTTIAMLPKDKDKEPEEEPKKPEKRPEPKKVERRPEPKKVEKKPVVAEVPAAACDLKGNAGARGMYQARNMDGAITAVQNCAKVKGPAAGRTQDVVQGLGQMKGLLSSAGQQEGSNPAAALNAYRSAEKLDKQLSGGLLGGYLGTKISALSARAGGGPKGPVAVPPPGPGPRPVPMPVASSDPKRDAEADKLLAEAKGVMGRDPGKAKLLCRQAMRLYGKDTNHPKYQQAYKLHASIKSRDDDED
jgi:tetratricopeptide (TPR) repeat protein